MSDKSDTPRTDERCAAIMAWQAKESDWPDFARQLERELSKAADLLRAHADALEENARLRAELAKLRQHAEEMERYKAFVDWMSLYGATISVVADERGSLRLDWYRGAVFGGSMDELMQALDDKISAYRADFPEETK